MKEINLKRATEIFLLVDRLREKREDAINMKTGLHINYLMEPQVGRNDNGQTRVIDQCDTAVLLGIPETELQEVATAAIVSCLDARIEQHRRDLKKLGVRLDDDTQPAKPEKILRITGPKANGKNGHKEAEA